MTMAHGSSTMLRIAFLCILGLSTAPAAARAEPRAPNKVILANPEKHLATFRLGLVHRDVRSGKASLLAPKAYPVAVEYWSGSSKVGWNKTALPGPGVYVFRLQEGLWRLAPYGNAASRKGAAPTRRTRSMRRSAGTRSRMRRSRFGFRTRLSPWGRTFGSLALIYRIVRDDAERELIWRVIVEGEIDADITRALESLWIAVPYGERRDLLEAVDWLRGMDESDWGQLDRLTPEDWTRLKDELGEQLPSADWDTLEGEWRDVETLPVERPGGGHEELDIGTLEENVDLDDLDGVAVPMPPGGEGLGGLLPPPPTQLPVLPPWREVDLPSEPDVDIDLDDYDGGGYDPGGGFDDMGGGDDFGGGWD